MNDLENHMVLPAFEDEPEMDEDEAYEIIRQQAIDDRASDLNATLADIGSGLRQHTVLMDDGSEVAIFENSPSAAIQTALERGYRPCEAVLCEEQEELKQSWADLLESIS